jgi:hypothetical protein
MQAGTRLAERPEPDQGLVITGLLRRLWRPDRTGTASVPSIMCDQWAHEFELKTARALPSFCSVGGDAVRPAALELLDTTGGH